MKAALETTTSDSTPSGALLQVQEFLPSEALNLFGTPEEGEPLMFDATTKQLRYGFRSSGIGFLIRQGVGSEVVPMLPVAIIPNGPAWLIGMINLRGNLVPVCDLHRMIGSNSGKSQEKQMILILDKGDKVTGFLIDGFPVAIPELHPLDQAPCIPQLLQKHVKPMTTSDQELWLELDHETLLEEAITVHES